MVKEWCLRVGNLLFVSETQVPDGKVVMQEIICVKVIREGKIHLMPKDNAEVLRCLANTCNAMGNGAGMPEWNGELDKALTLLRVYATNTYSSIQS